MFRTRSSRFASFGIISNLPGEVIDSIWMIIDNNLQGVLPLDDLLTFHLENNQGNLTIRFVDAETTTEIAVDLPFGYEPSFPEEVLAYDDGQAQTIMLPDEGTRE